MKLRKIIICSVILLLMLPFSIITTLAATFNANTRILSGSYNSNKLIQVNPSNGGRAFYVTGNQLDGERSFSVKVPDNVTSVNIIVFDIESGNDTRETVATPNVKPAPTPAPTQPKPITKPKPPKKDQDANIQRRREVEKKPEVRPLNENASLQGITTNYGKLEPAFNEDVFEYTLTIDDFYRDLKIIGEAVESSTVVINEANIKYTDQKADVKIKTRSESGETKEYTIHVVVNPTAKTTIKVKDKEISVFAIVGSLIDFEDLKLEKIKINDQEIEAYTYGDGKISLIYGKEQDQESSYYLYQADEMLEKVNPVIYNNQFYGIMDIEEKQGFKVSEFELAGQKVKGLVYNDNENYYYFKAFSLTQGVQYYRYEVSQKTIQLEQKSNFDVYEKNDQMITKLKKNNQLLLISTISLGILSSIGIVAIIILALKLKKKK